MLNRISLALCAAVSASFALGINSAAMAAFIVTPDNNGNDLLNSLLGTTTGLSNFSVTTTGNAEAFGLFSGDPFGLKQGIVLSTGKVVDVVGPNNVGNKTTNFGTIGDTPGSFDLAKLDISFDADNTVDKLFFNYVFGSEEFLEFAGSQFNDSFELLLNGTNLALLDNVNPVTINNLATSPTGPFNSAFIQNIGNDTQLDGYTKILTFTGLLNKNAKNTLSIKIKDVADGILDSATFIQGGSLGTIDPTKTPEPSSMLAMLAMGGLSVASLKSKQHKKTGSQA